MRRSLRASDSTHTDVLAGQPPVAARRSLSTRPLQAVESRGVNRWRGVSYVRHSEAALTKTEGSDTDYYCPSLPSPRCTDTHGKQGLADE